MSREHANIIANAMKVWALENGATHYTHWFMPLNGSSAGKHDSFLELSNDQPILEFNGKNLIKGEPDASSFASGGLRATFEARGYTSWDTTSPAFIKNGSLYIPTLFSSYNGEALDNKIPLLKSCEVLNKETTKLLNRLGYSEITSVHAYVGSEQEYFLIPEEFYNKRIDLKLTGRTLFGAASPKSQDLIEHYYRSIKPKVIYFMKDLDEELWKYGIPAKTKHNEASPSQFEIACIYRKVNVTTDNNHLLMELLDEIATKHGLKCLLHEKPFKGINGSGKHNNYSLIATSSEAKINLFSPGNDPINNLSFLIILSCFIKGVDEFRDLLELTITSPGNFHRLGGNEAPPKIISIYLGEELTKLIDAVIEGKEICTIKKDRFNIGLNYIPDFSKDNNDRNRTSPLAFTGNKFEFRGVGSSDSIAFVNTILNTILAYEINQINMELDYGTDIYEIIKSFLKEHKKIIFNGDGYSLDWLEEAKNRGIAEEKDIVEIFESLKDKKNITLFTMYNIFSETELSSRYEILLNNYCNKVKVEALTAAEMINKMIYPGSIKYLNELLNTYNLLKNTNLDYVFLENDILYLIELLKKIKNLTSKLRIETNNIEKNKKNLEKNTRICYNIVSNILEELREVVDKVESIVKYDYWPLPTYNDILFSL